MKLGEYTRSLGWSISELARQASMDFNTARKALEGQSISARSANKIASALSKALGERILVTDIEDLKVGS